jgi:hypothetical protein
MEAVGVRDPPAVVARCTRGNTVGKKKHIFYDDDDDTRRGMFRGDLLDVSSALIPFSSPSERRRDER